MTSWCWRVVRGCVLVGMCAIATTGAAWSASKEPGPALPHGTPGMMIDQSLFDATQTPPDINNIPVMTDIVKTGGKLYYMGERSGMHGWFIVKDGQVQMIYLAPDQKTVLLGALFTTEGKSVTGEQVRYLSNTNKDVSALLTAAANQSQEIAGSAPSASASVATSTAALTTGSGGELPTIPMSPSERLYQDMKNAAGVTLGTNPNAELFMVVNTDCPHCQKTWHDSLKDYVKNGRIQVRLIPVADQGSDSLRSGARLLGAADPLAAWDKYTDGDKSALAGDADDLHTRAVVNNRGMIDKWNIKATPYIVYRAKDGRVKIVQGEIKRMDAVVLDLLK